MSIMKKIKFIVVVFASSFLTISYSQEKAPSSFSLKSSIEYGLSHHISAEVYANMVDQSKYEVREYLSNYLPQVSLNASLDDNIKLQQTVIPEGTFFPGSPEQRVAFGSKWNSAVTATATQVIYNQSMISGIDGVKKKKNLTIMQGEQNNETIIYNVASSYFQLLVAQKSLELLQSNKERLEEILRIVELQSNQGVAKKVDVSQVRVNLNNVLSQISNLENNIAIAESSLKVNMGLDINAPIELTDINTWIENKPTLQEYAAFNYENTLEGKMQQLQMELLDINRKSIRYQIIPTLSLYARYGANTMAQKFPDLYNPILDYSAMGLQLSWNIFTGLRRNSQYKQASIELTNTKLNYELNGSLMQLQYKNAESQSNEAQRMMLTNKENLELAQEVYDNTTLQYQQGVATLSDLLNAELSYKEAHNNYINSLLKYYIADLSVHKANGTLQEYYKSL